jgi:uncharacterized membrane protein YvbJ
MFCFQCGNEVKDGEKFCTNCGQAVNVAPKENAAPTNQPQAILGILLLVIKLIWP